MPAHASISVLLVRPVIAALGGAPPEAFWRATDLTPEIVADADARVSAAQFCVVWAEAIRISGDPQIALATAAVASLRNFETAYRTNLTSHLRSQIETLESGRAEPGEIPDVVRELKPVEGHANGIVSGQGEHGGADQREEAPSYSGGPSSNTPRLDALLGDQR